MSVVDLQELEEVKGLVLKGQQVGVLTFAEIAVAVQEIDLDEADVEELHGFLEKSEIELVEEIDPALATQEERAPDKRRQPRTTPSPSSRWAAATPAGWTRRRRCGGSSTQESTPSAASPPTASPRSGG